MRRPRRSTWPRGRQTSPLEETRSKAATACRRRERRLHRWLETQGWGERAPGRDPRRQRLQPRRPTWRRRRCGRCGGRPTRLPERGWRRCGRHASRGAGSRLPTPGQGRSRWGSRWSQLSHRATPSWGARWQCCPGRPRGPPQLAPRPPLGCPRRQRRRGRGRARARGGRATLERRIRAHWARGGAGREAPRRPHRARRAAPASRRRRHGPYSQACPREGDAVRLLGRR